MATRDGAYVKNQLHGRGLTIRWAGLLLGDDGLWMQLARWKYRCVHVYGTFGGAQIFIEGTNEDANFTTPTNQVTLKDQTQIELVFPAAGIREIHENPLCIRPRVLGGDGTTDLTVVMVCRD